MPDPRRLHELPRLSRSLDLEILVGNPGTNGVIGRQTVRELLSAIEARLVALEGASGGADGPGGAVDTGLTIADVRAAILDNVVDLEEGRDTTDAIQDKAPTVNRIGLETARLSDIIARERTESMSVQGTRVIINLGSGEETRQVEANLSELDHFLYYWGAWSSTATYDQGDVVRYESNHYLCIVDSPAGTLPSDETHWLNVTFRSNPDSSASSNYLYTELVIATKSHTAPAQPTGITFDGTTIGGLASGYVPLADVGTLGPPSTPTWYLETRTWSNNGGLTWTIQTPWNIAPENNIEYSNDLEQWYYPRTDQARWARIYHTDGTTSQPFSLQITPQNRQFIFGISRRWNNNNGTGDAHSVTLSPESPLDLRNHNTFGMFAVTWLSKALPPAETPQFRSVARLMFHPNHIAQWIGVSSSGANSSPMPHLIAHVGKDDTQLYWSNTITTSDTLAPSHWQQRAAFAIFPHLNANGTIYAFTVTFLPGGTTGTDVMGNLALEMF